MTTLHVIVDELTAAIPGDISRYAEELGRALIETAPLGCVVDGIVASSSDSELQQLRERLPGIAGFVPGALTRDEIESAWQHGFTALPTGMIHAPSLLAPLQRHDRLRGTGHQLVVTVNDALAVAHPEMLDPRLRAWQITMLERAERYADAVVVPTHAVADDLSARFDFGDRVRVIGAAASTRLALPRARAPIANALRLPKKFVLATVDGRATNADLLLTALALPAAHDIPLVAVGSGAAALVDDAARAGLTPGRVIAVGPLTETQWAVALDRATALVVTTPDAGFGLRLLDAFHLGTPVVHAAAPALLEITADAGVAIETGDGFSERLADGIGRVIGERGLATRLGVLGRDRAGLFSWRGAAEKIWQLHADL